MGSQNDDRESLIPIENNRSTHGTYERSEPFDIEGSYVDSQERPFPIPSFITKQKTLYEKSKCIRFIFFCCSKSLKQNLISNIKNKELKVYYKIKSLASQLFDENNIHHKESLKFLYMICINKEITNEEDHKTIEWKKVGFQVKFYTFLPKKFIKI